MSYKLKDKRARNKRIENFIISHPDMTQTSIAKIFRISQSRVSRILKKVRND